MSLDFVLGVVAAMIIGWLWFQFSIWWGKLAAFFKPQTVTHKTEKSPFQVLLAALVPVVAIFVGLFLAAFVLGDDQLKQDMLSGVATIARLLLLLLVRILSFLGQLVAVLLKALTS